LRDAVSDAELEMVAQLVTLRVSALDLAAIRPGDTLWFKPPPSVKVLVQASHVFDAEYGTADGNAAIRIERVLDPPADSQNVSEGAAAESAAESEGADNTTLRKKRVAMPTGKNAGATAA